MAQSFSNRSRFILGQVRRIRNQPKSTQTSQKNATPTAPLKL
jgi:hypothetical protein